ncbi:MAG: hypothetical protein RL571_301 [Pseudomonadota bacterium]
MSLSQSGAFIEDSSLLAASQEAAYARVAKECNWSTPIERIQCRLYPKISIYFDGTGNNLYLEQAKPVEKQAISNVARLFLAAKSSKDDRECFRIYIPGVGTPFKSELSEVGEDKGGVLGLAFGSGGEMRLLHALLSIKDTLDIKYGDGAIKHIRDIQVDVFGFSRGATQARAFVRRLLDEQCEINAEGGVLWRSHFGKKAPFTLNFLGLFDTVASVGGPGLHKYWANDLRIPPQVKRCVHLVAAHELRSAFPLDSIAFAGVYPPNSKEVIYPGVHSDVGGGYYPNQQGRSNDLAKIPLREMYLEALKAGVMLFPIKNLPDDAIESEFKFKDPSVLSAYTKYLECLPQSGGDLVAQIRAHRTPFIHWRSMLARRGDASTLLAGLRATADCNACLAAPERRPQFQHNDQHWKDKVLEYATEQGKQLISEQKRLVNRIEFMRAPYDGVGKNRVPRPQTEYEQCILAAWDNKEALPDSTEAFLTQYIHDSVAHFSGWPCALYDPREIYLHKDTVIAQQSTDPLIVG